MRFFFVAAFLMALAISLAAASTKVDEQFGGLPLGHRQQRPSSYLRGAAGAAHQYYMPRAAASCSQSPQVCLFEGSLGPDCCGKQCVDVKTDVLNCGRCSNRCKFAEACCAGGCANLMGDVNNCGGCNKKCKEGSSCVFGMCSYAYA